MMLWQLTERQRMMTHSRAWARQQQPITSVARGLLRAPHPAYSQQQQQQQS